MSSAKQFEGKLTCCMALVSELAVESVGKVIFRKFAINKIKSAQIGLFLQTRYGVFQHGLFGEAIPQMRKLSA
ncbi:MAG: hypothetical protein HZC12_02335 [Nitrospirae bacterium]|nr:hypothetical protein [Nitrospirota bacterium]